LSWGLAWPSATGVIACETKGNPAEATPHFTKALLLGFSNELIVLCSFFA
jgi:hypothetical protein